MKHEATDKKDDDPYAIGTTLPCVKVPGTFFIGGISPNFRFSGMLYAR
jgi:hypothetical protein